MTSLKKDPDRTELFHIAEQQAGYFTSAQAVKAGFQSKLLWHYEKTGQFSRVAHGVYRLTQYPASPLEDLFIAWLRCGPKAVISHESALAVYDLSDLIPGQVHVTVPRTASRRRRGIRQHTSGFRSKDIKRREGLPVTSVPRTIADVAKAGLAEEMVKEAIRQALKQGLTNKDSLLSEGRRRGGRARRLISKYVFARGAQL